MGKDLRSGTAPEVVQKESGLPRFALVPEDVPIDLGVIATRIETAPHCRIINAALQPLRQVLEKSERLIDRAQRRRSSRIPRKYLRNRFLHLRIKQLAFDITFTVLYKCSEKCLQGFRNKILP